MACDILIVDDEADIRELVAGILTDEGHHARLAHDADSALAEISLRLPALLVLDIWLQGSRIDGMAVLDLVRADHPELPVVIISGHGTIELAVAAIRKGAYDFIEKPFKADRLIIAVERALETHRLRRENLELKRRAGEEGELVGVSAAMTQLRQLLEKVGPMDSRVLVSGPPGSGKEVAARLLHATSRRAGAPFIAINAASIAPERMEVELFGVEESQTERRRIGVFEQAHGGTLFLDEVADMPLETQSKILRVLVDQTFTRVGGATRVRVDVRVVSSTSRDLRSEIAAGRFREDLFHRLNVMPIRMPPLAERREDVPVLIGHFMARLSEATGLAPCRISEDAMAALQAHHWPGNVRQLRNNVERMMILASEEGGLVTAEMLPGDIGAQTPFVTHGAASELLISMPLRDARERFEREYLVAQLNRFGGNISRTATFIGMERSALHRKLKLLGISVGSLFSEVGP